MHRRILLLIMSLLLLGASQFAVSADLSPSMGRMMAISADHELLPVVIFLDNRLTMDEVYPDAKVLPMDQRREFVISVLKDRFQQMSPGVMSHLRLAKKSGKVSLLRPLWILNAVRTTATLSVLRELQEFPEIIYLAYDPPRYNTLDDGWGVTEMGALQVQDELGVTGEGVLVGHKDSGINYERTGFEGRIWINPGEDINSDGIIDGTDENDIDDDGNGYVDDFRGWNFDENTNNVLDDNGHGTKTSSVICSNPVECDRVSVAPGATLMILLGYDFQGSVWESSQYAIEHGVQVISASLSFKQSDCDNGGTLDCPNRIAHRWVSEMELAAGIIHANSTGNEGVTNPIPMSAASPSDCPPPAMTEAHEQHGGVSSIVAVAAYNVSGNYEYYSGRGASAWSRDDICVNDRMPFCGPVGSASEFPPEFEDYIYWDAFLPGLLKPDITAPTNVAALSRTGGCSSIGGTSGATPHVGGALALIYSAFPGITPEEAYVVLVEGATDAGDAGPDNTWGFGKLQIYDAIEPVYTTIGRVAGRVLSEGVPVEGCRVILGEHRPVYTDENGDYTISAHSGLYDIEFYKYGYQTITNSVTITAPNVTDEDALLLDAETASLTITLENGNGEILPDISVSIPAAGLYGLTDDQGMIEFPSVYEGTHIVTVGENQEYWELRDRLIGVESGGSSITITLSRSNYTIPTGNIEVNGYIAYDNLDWYGQPYNWIEINPDLEGDGELLNFTSDACIAKTLPFTFSFYGSNTSSIRISPNGYITFNTSCQAAWNILPIPSDITPNALCAVLWTDFFGTGGGGGSVYYYADGERAIIEWYDVKQWDGFPPGRATFQVILYPSDSGDGDIVCQYAAISGRIEAVVGIEDSDGEMGLQYAHQLQYSDGAAPIRAGRTIFFSPDLLISADEPITVPGSFVLHQNYPNPFNPSTTFSFEAPRAANVSLSLFDLLGRKTATVFEGRAAAGLNEITYDASHLAAGMYFARLTANGKSVGLRKVMLLK